MSGRAVVSECYDQVCRDVHRWWQSERGWHHGLRTHGEEIAFSARPKIHFHSQIFRYGQSLFCLPHRPKFSDFFDLCLHWVSVVRVLAHLQVWKISFKHCGINMRMLHQNSISPFVLFFFAIFWSAQFSVNFWTLFYKRLSLVDLLEYYFCPVMDIKV